jgi:hypothetical protein
MRLCEVWRGNFPLVTPTHLYIGTIHYCGIICQKERGNCHIRHVRIYYAVLLTKSDRSWHQFSCVTVLQVLNRMPRVHCALFELDLTDG